MSREVSAWVGKTDDTAIPPRVRDRVFQKAGGRCKVCTRELRKGHWECDHIIPLILGGGNSEDNLQAICSDPCHANKSRLDVKLKAKVARVRKHHIGIKKPRTIRSWRKFNGTPVHASRER